MKTRLTLLDIIAEVRDLHHLVVGQRLVNIYDVDDKTFLLKFAEPDREKQLLLVESGQRIHTTRYARDKPTLPGGFTMKLRKHIRSKRLTAIALAGMDRVVDMSFGTGPATCHLLLELYDKGNVILTDAAYSILALLRQYTLEGTASTSAAPASEGAAPAAAAAGAGGKAAPSSKSKDQVKDGAAAAADGRVRIAVKQTYTFRGGAPPPSSSSSVPAEGPAKLNEPPSAPAAAAPPASAAATAEPAIDISAPLSDLTSSLARFLHWYETVRLPQLPAKARKKATLSSCLVHKGSGVDSYGPALVEHALASAGMDSEAGIGSVRAAAAVASVAPAANGGKAARKAAQPAAPVLPPGPESYDSGKLAVVAAALQQLPSVLASIRDAPYPTPAYALMEVTQQTASSQALGQGATDAAASALTAALQRQQGASNSSSSSASVSSSASAGISFFGLRPSADGLLGSWQQLQETYREAVGLGASGSSSSASASSATAGSAPDTSGTSAATSASAAASAPAAATSDEASGGGAAADDGGGGGIFGAGETAQSPATVPVSFVDFMPMRLAQYAAQVTGPSAPLTLVSFPSFNDLCDEYYSRLDVARAHKAEAAARAAAAKKVERIREGHTAALAALAESHSEAYTKGRVLEAHAGIVDAACLVVRSALEHGINWIDLQRLVDAEAAGGNPVARLIVGMDLGKGRITLALRDEEAAAAAAAEEEGEDGSGSSGDDSDDEDDDGDEQRGGGGLAAVRRRQARQAGKAAPSDSEDDSDSDSGSDSDDDGEGSDDSDADDGRRKRRGKTDQGRGAKGKGVVGGRKLDKWTRLIEVDVFDTAAANARHYFASGKAAREKSAKTAAAAEVSIRNAERAAETAAAKQIAAASAARAISLVRKPAWYERFSWFITSEGYLVVGGKNAQDNELLWKRYMRPQDAYVHADVHGAATVIVRNTSNDPSSGATIPPLTLEQAGAFCVALSSAWGSGVSTSAWWVTPGQVSKTAPTGEYLTTGAFMIRGRKNFLPPVRLELGLALLFKVDDACVDRHLGDRYVRGRPEGQPPTVMVAAAASATAAEAVPAPPASDDSQPPAELSAPPASEQAAPASVPPFSISSPTAADAKEGEDEEEQQVQDENEAAVEAATAEKTDDNAGEAAADTDIEEEVAALPVPSGDPSASAPTPSAAPAAAAITAAVRRRAKKLQTLKGLSASAALAAALQEASAKKSSGGGSGKGGEEDSGSDGEGTPAAASSKRKTQQQGGKGGKAPSAPTPASSQQLKRGQKAKLKKAKERYGEQDEEERRLAMAALGHALPQGEGGKGGSASQGAGTAAKPSASSSAAAASSVPTPKATAGSGQQKQPRAPKPAPAAGDDDGDEDGGASRAEDSAASDARALASLVPVPRPDDVLLHVVPMVCPYSVALGCKYRVKLTPGQLKKGKAAQAVEHLLKEAAEGSAGGGKKGSSKAAAVVAGGAASGTARERELISAIPHDVMVAAVIANCRVTAAPPWTSAAAGGGAGAGGGADSSSGAAGGGGRGAGGRGGAR